MRPLFRNIRIVEASVFILCWCAISQAYARRAVAIVQSVRGHVFYSHKGKVKTLAPGMRLTKDSEVFTEEGGQITFNDYFDHVYHLSGSGHIALSGRSVALKSGYLWVQFMGDYPTPFAFQIVTANTKVSHRSGEAIVSFDSSIGKTQLLVLTGVFEIQNALQEHLKLDVQEGQFSFIKNGYLEGAPRMPTPIGLHSYERVTGLFDAVEPLRKTQGLFDPNASRKRPGRSIASVKIRPESSLLNHYRIQLVGREEKKALPRPNRGPASFYGEEDGEPSQREVPIKIFGQEKQKTQIFHCPRDCPWGSKLAPHLKQGRKVSSTPPPVLREFKVKIWGAKKRSAPIPTPTPVPVPVSKPVAALPPPTPPQKETRRAPASIAPIKPAKRPTISEEPLFEQALNQHYSEQKRHATEVNELIDQLQSVQMDYQKSY